MPELFYKFWTDLKLEARVFNFYFLVLVRNGFTFLGQDHNVSFKVPELIVTTSLPDGKAARAERASIGRKFIKLRRVLCVKSSTSAYCGRASQPSRQFSPDARLPTRDLVRDLARQIRGSQCASRTGANRPLGRYGLAYESYRAVNSFSQSSCIRVC